MIRIDWNPIAHVGPIPINWYGLGWATAFLTGRWLVLRWLRGTELSRERLEELLSHPWRIVAVWEGGLAFFGGLFGAIGRIPCGLDGMDYGTASSLPWAVVYTNPNSFAPTDGIPRHPDQYYELLGDLLIAWVLLKLRRRLPEGATFYLYLTLFAALRFALFFVLGNVPTVALGLKNAQWTALAILAVAIPGLVIRLSRRALRGPRA